MTAEPQAQGDLVERLARARDAWSMSPEYRQLFSDVLATLQSLETERDQWKADAGFEHLARKKAEAALQSPGLDEEVVAALVREAMLEYADQSRKALVSERVEMFSAISGKTARAIIALSGSGNGSQSQPIDMVLFCPACGVQHIDAADDSLPTEEAWEPANGLDTWTNPPHRSHLCQGCGHIWRPADVATNGVAAVQTRGKADSAKALGSSNASPGATEAGARAHYSTDPEMDAALREDAAKLRLLGVNPGRSLDDLEVLQPGSEPSGAFADLLAVAELTAELGQMVADSYTDMGGIDRLRLSDGTIFTGETARAMHALCRAIIGVATDARAAIAKANSDLGWGG